MGPLWEGVVVSGPGIGAVGLVGQCSPWLKAALVGVTLALTKREESREVGTAAPGEATVVADCVQNKRSGDLLSGGGR